MSLLRYLVTAAKDAVRQALFQAAKGSEVESLLLEAYTILQKIERLIENEKAQ